MHAESLLSAIEKRFADVLQNSDPIYLATAALEPNEAIKILHTREADAYKAVSQMVIC